MWISQRAGSFVHICYNWSKSFYYVPKEAEKLLLIWLLITKMSSFCHIRDAGLNGIKHTLNFAFRHTYCRIKVSLLQKGEKKSHHSGLMCPTQMIFQQWFSLYWSFSIIGLWFLLSYCVILHHCGWFSCMTWWLSYFISIVSHL